MRTTVEYPQPLWRGIRIKPIYLWAILLALPVLGITAFAVFQPIQVLPRISLGPGFAFVDQNGERLTNEDLRGKFVIYTFGYTHCDAACPDTGPAMREIQELIAGLDTQGVPVEFVTIFFDPERDTPARLQAYAERIGADTEDWHLVTGDPVRLKNVIGGGFSTYYEQQEDGEIRFDPAFVLVDGWGIIRAKYKTASPDLAIVERDIGLLVNELNNSEGAARFAYEAAHLFLCYPD
jgi:protein SCO1/2